MGGFKSGVLVFTSPKRYQFLLIGQWHKLPLFGSYFPPEEDIPLETIEKPTLAMEAIRAQRTELKKKREQIEEVESKLSIEQKRIDKEMRKLKRAQNDLEMLVAHKEEIEDNNLGQLAASYARMEPQDAANALSAMDDRDVINILVRMKEKNVSRIMAKMDPKRAAIISGKMIHIKRR